MWAVLLAIGAMAISLSSPRAAFAQPADWRAEWPRTDFSRTAVNLEEIISGGPRRDGIPPIDDPAFTRSNRVEGLGPREPVIGLVIGGDARAYPLRILIWHEIVNDVVGGVPVAVTYCPLCNSAVVFDRRVAGRTLSFGTTGKLRNSDLVMYDRQTETWWQQFTGAAIVGTLVGERLTTLPSRVESLERFQARAPSGRVLLPPGARRLYGTNPYRGYDRANWPFLFRGSYDGPVPPLSRVVVVGDQAWPLELVRRRGRIVVGDIVIAWEEGQSSALDAELVIHGWDVGNVTVIRQGRQGPEDVVHDIAFAFAFRAFHPQGTIHSE